MAFGGSRAQDTLNEHVMHVSEVTSNVKENVVKSVDNVKQVGEVVGGAVAEGIAPVLETRWQLLQVDTLARCSCMLWLRAHTCSAERG